MANAFAEQRCSRCQRTESEVEAKGDHFHIPSGLCYSCINAGKSKPPAEPVFKKEVVPSKLLEAGNLTPSVDYSRGFREGYKYALTCFVSAVKKIEGSVDIDQAVLASWSKHE